MTASAADLSAAALIDRRIAELGGWRGRALARVRKLIHEADAGIVEEWKWQNPVWSRDGIVCTGEAYKAAVKLTFPKGASLEDPAGLFNSSLEGAVRRAIDIREGDEPDAAALKALLRAAIAANAAGKAKPGATKAAARPSAKAAAKTAPGKTAARPAAKRASGKSAA
ncbi:MAG TPA: DUF1801 domain-containing protein [Burkholderiaceae bacterium]